MTSARRRAVTLMGAAALVVLVVPVGCSGQRVVDHTKLEQGIIDESSSGPFTITSVACPEGRPLVEGDTFTCQARLSSGEQVTVDATQTDGDGHITWKRVEAVLAGEDFTGIENGVISREYGIPVTLDCPALIVVNDGDTFTCQGTDDRGHTRTVTFTAVHPHDGEFTHVVEGLPPPSTTTTTTTTSPTVPAVGG